MQGSPFGINETVLGAIGMDQQRKATNTAIDAILNYGKEALSFYREQWQTTLDNFKPFLEYGQAGIQNLNQFLPNYMNNILAPYSDEYRNFQLNRMQVDPETGLVSSPDLDKTINFEFDPEDEVYKAKLDEQKKRDEAWLSKQGLLNSTAGKTLMDKSASDITNAEVEKQYGRAMENRDYLNRIAMQQYALDTESGNRRYGRLVNQRNMLSEDDQAQLDMLAKRYGIDRDLFSAMYGSYIDQAKIGQGAASSAGNISVPYAQGGANIMTGMGNSVAGANMFMGNANSNYMNNLANIQNNQGNTAGNIMSMLQRYGYMGGGNSGGGGGGGYGGGYAYSGGQPGMTDTYDIDYGAY